MSRPCVSWQLAPPAVLIGRRRYRRHFQTAGSPPPLLLLPPLSAVRLGPVPALPRCDVSPWRQSPWVRSPLGGDGAGPVRGPAPAARPRRTAPPVWPTRPPPAAGRSRDPSPSPLSGAGALQTGTPPFSCLINRGGAPISLKGTSCPPGLYGQTLGRLGGTPHPLVLQGKFPPSGCTGPPFPPSYLIRGIPLLQAVRDPTLSYLTRWTRLSFPPPRGFRRPLLTHPRQAFPFCLIR